MKRGGTRCPWLVLALLCAWLPGKAPAHPAQFVTLQVAVAPTGEFRASLNLDILAYALGKPSVEASNEELAALLDGPRAGLAQTLADAAGQFRREVVVRTDVGDAVPADWALPGLPDVDAALARHIVPRILIAGEIRFSGVLPAGAHTLSVRLPYVLGETVHVYAVPGGADEGQLVPAGDYGAVVHFALPSPPPAPAGSTGVLREAAGRTWRAGVAGALLAAVALAALAALVANWPRRCSWSRRVLLIPASILAALTSLICAAQRFFQAR